MDAWPGIGGAAGGLLLFAAALFLLVLCVLWVILPFALFGIKSRLDTVNDNLAMGIGPRLQEANDRLGAIMGEIGEIRRALLPRRLNDE